MPRYSTTRFAWWIGLVGLLLVPTPQFHLLMRAVILVERMNVPEPFVFVMVLALFAGVIVGLLGPAIVVYAAERLGVTSRVRATR